MPFTKHEQSGIETRALLTLRQRLTMAWDRFRGMTTITPVSDPSHIVELFAKYGPLNVLVEPKEGEDWWPLGRVLMGVEVESYSAVSGPIENSASIDIKWRDDRPLRTGLMYWLRGP